MCLSLPLVLDTTETLHFGARVSPSLLKRRAVEPVAVSEAAVWCWFGDRERRWRGLGPGRPPHPPNPPACMVVQGQTRQARCYR